MKVGELILSSIVNFWSFNDIIVYLCKSGELYNLYFVKDSILLNQLDNFVSPEMRLTIVNTKIFIFTAGSLHYFDIRIHTAGDAKEFIHIPKTKVISTTVETPNESPNILTTAEIYTYLYNSAVGIPPTIKGRVVDYEVLGETYRILFNVHTTDVLVNVKFTIAAEYSKYFTDEHYKSVSLAISSENTFAMYSYETRTLLYSVDGITFKLIDTLTLVGDEQVYLRRLSFTQDNNYVYLRYGLYRIYCKCKADTNTLTMRFPTFTSVKTYVTQTDFYVMFSHLYNNDIWTLFDFITYDDFAGVSGAFTEQDSYSYSYLYYFRYSHGNYQERRTDYIGSPLQTQNSSFPEYVRYSKSFLSNQYDGCLLIYCAQNMLPTAPWDESLSVLIVVGFTEMSSSIIVARTCVYDSDFAFHSFDARILENKIIFVDVEGDSSYRYYVIDSSLALSTPHYISKVIETDAPLYRHHIYLSTMGDKLLTDQFVYSINDNTMIPLIVLDDPDNNEGIEMVIPLAFTDYIYYILKTGDAADNSTNILTSYFADTVEFEYLKEGTYSYFLPSHIVELTSEYLAKDNTLYISEYRENVDGNFMWYLPKISTQKFNYPITNLQPISQSEMGVFLEKEIWYVYKTELGYAYNKSKLQVGTKEGADIIVSYDGSKIMFPCERGFVALSYQDFVASTEQALTFLSDNIYTLFKDYNKSATSLIEHGFWVIIYTKGSKNGFIFDIRNNSWWPISCTTNVDKFIVYNEEVQLLSNGNVYVLNKTDDEYYDYDGVTKK